MSKPPRQEQRPVDDVLRGSLADIASGRVQDFDAFLVEMSEKIGRRVAEVEADGRLSPVVRPAS